MSTCLSCSGTNADLDHGTSPAAAAIAEAAGATVSLFHSRVFPNPFLIVVSPELTPALVRMLADAKAVDDRL